MKFLDKIKKFSVAKNWFGLALAGLVIAVIAALMIFLPDKTAYEPIQATVCEIEAHEEAEGTFIDAVYVDYEVNGVPYRHIALSSFQSGMKLGDVLDCQYDTENPEIIRQTGGELLPWIIGGIGLLAFVFGLYKLITTLRRSSDSFEEFNRAALSEADPKEVEAIRFSSELPVDYVWHFTGKLNQSYVMKDLFGAEVYRADCEKVTLIQDTAYDFADLRTGETSRKMIGHTLTVSTVENLGFSFRVPITSAFKVDGVNNWEYLAALGYGFDFSLRGLTPCFEVNHLGVRVAHIESCGTEILDEKYENNPLAKIPGNGLYKISCRPSDIPAVFFICFCLNRIDLFG